MKVLITGGAGFLGRWFVRHHIGIGDQVLAIDNFSSAGSIWALGSYHKVRDDLGEWLATAKGHYDLAYHFAAPVGGRVKIEGDPLFNADSLRLDSAFFRWAVTHVKTAVYPSSSAVYGVILQGKQALSLHEGMFSAANPNWLAPDEMYGFTKLVGEKLAYTAASYGLNTLCLRPFSGYGEGQSLDYPVPSIALRALRREDPLTVWGPGTQKRDFIHVEDLVAATIARLAEPVNGYESINLGSGFAVTFNAVAATCADLVGYRPEITNNAAKPTGVLTRWADVSRMKRYYHADLIPLREGLRRVIESLDG